MPSPRTKRVLTTVALAAGLITVIACGSKATPTTTSTEEPGNGGVGIATGTATTEPSSAPGSSNPPPGGSSSKPASAYPSNAKDYGLAVLKAIKDNDQTRIVDLADLNTAQYHTVTHQDFNLNGSWVNTDCSSGSNPTCNYYNQTGATAIVILDSSKLGKAHAVTAVSFNNESFSSDAGGYVQQFIAAWIAGSNVSMMSHANSTVVNFVKSKTAPGGGFVTAPTACGTNRMCVTSGSELAGGQPFGQLIKWTVDTTKLGKPNAILSAANA
jgi:hypothetical protein